MTVAVIGDGAVGLCGVIAAKRLGARQIIMLGRHRARYIDELMPDILDGTINPAMSSTASSTSTATAP